MLTMLAKLLKAFNAEGSPAQISLGFMFGMMVGLTPFWSLSNLLILFVVFLFRINLTAFFLSLAVFAGVAYIFDPQMNSLGAYILNHPQLTEMWTAMYMNDLWRLTHFNNTLTLGALALGLLMAVPLYFTSNFAIKKYRNHLLAWVRQTRLVKFIKSSRFYSIYEHISDLNLT